MVIDRFGLDPVGVLSRDSSFLLDCRKEIYKLAVGNYSVLNALRTNRDVPCS